MQSSGQSVWLISRFHCKLVAGWGGLCELQAVHSRCVDLRYGLAESVTNDQSGVMVATRRVQLLRPRQEAILRMLVAFTIALLVVQISCLCFK